MKEHATDDPEVEFREGFCAFITWQECQKQPETVRDDFNLEGVKYLCEQCPYLERGLDGRRKLWPCRYSLTGHARLDEECCEVFYKKLALGQIAPIDE